MREGVLDNSDNREDFILYSVYPNNIYPVSYILTGLKSYGLTGNWSYLGIHMMDTSNCLIHPSRRESLQIVQKSYDMNLMETPKGNYLSMISFELWELQNLIQQGMFQAYELLFMPEIYRNPEMNSILSLCREALNNRIGEQAIQYSLFQSRRRITSRRVILSYYRLLQAIYFLRERDFEWNIKKLFFECNVSSIAQGQDLLLKYIDGDTTPPKNIFGELSSLMQEVDSTVLHSTLSDISSQSLLDKIDNEIITQRLKFT